MGTGTLQSTSGKCVLACMKLSNKGAGFVFLELSLAVQVMLVASVQLNAFARRSCS